MLVVEVWIILQGMNVRHVFCVKERNRDETRCTSLLILMNISEKDVLDVSLDTQPLGK